MINVSNTPKPDGATRKSDVAGPSDSIFAEPVERLTDFAFDARTAGVFDDMLGRSVPFYAEIQRMTGELAADFAAPGSNLYDLGCSTGTTLATLEPLVDPSVRFIGVDSSPEMLEKARSKIGQLPSARRPELVHTDLQRRPGVPKSRSAHLAGSRAPRARGT
jgi:tRNA (cmo5U34)-methyltransferase